MKTNKVNLGWSSGDGVNLFFSGLGLIYYLFFFASKSFAEAYLRL